MRETRSFTEIQSLFVETIENGLSLMVWQRRDDNSISFQAHARLLEISENGVLKYFLYDCKGDVSKAEVFFASMDSTILFKTKDFEYANNTMLLTIPFEVKRKERRTSQRVKIKVHELRYIEINIFAKNQRELNALTVNCQLIDLSDTGACLLVSKETFQKIDTNLAFTIKSLTTLEIAGNKARVMNSRKYKGPTLSQGEFYALGIMFV